MWRLKLYGKSRQWQATLGYSTHSMQIMESVRVRLKASVRTSLMNLYPLYSSGSWWRATVSFREGRNMNTVPGRLNCHSVWNGRMPEERLMQFAPTSSRLEILLNILWLLTSGSPILITNWWNLLCLTHARVMMKASVVARIFEDALPQTPEKPS